MLEDEEEAEATEQSLTDPVLWQRIGPIGSGSAGVTRRGVLASLGGAISLLGLSGTAVSETPAVSPQVSGPRSQEGSPRPVRADPRWRGGGHAEPASGHCPPETLAETWRSPALEDGVNSVLVQPDSSDERPVYASGIDFQSLPPVGHIHALDPTTGEELDGWPVETDGVPILRFAESPLLFVGEVNPTTSGASIRALDPRSGTTEWERQLPQTQVTMDFRYDSSQEVVFATTDGPVVTGVDATDGTEVWSEELSTGGQFQFPVTRREGETLYIPMNEVDQDTGEIQSATVWAVDTGAGVTNRELWSLPRSDQSISAVPAVSDETVVAGFGPAPGSGTDESSLVAIDASDGTERWSKSRSDNLVWSGVFNIFNSSLYATAGVSSEDAPSEGVVVKIDPASGTVEWEFDIGAGPFAVQVDGDNVYFGTSDGDVFAVDDDSGNQVWQRSFGSESANAVIVACETVYVGLDGDTVHTLDADEGTTIDTYTVASGTISTVYPQRGSVWAATTPEVTVPVGTQGTDNRVYRLDGGSSDPPEGPEASFTVDPPEPTAGESVTFDASGSTGDVETYEWASDADGFPDTGLQVTHTFETAGNYDVTLTVTDAEGNTDATTETVVVSEPGEGPPALPGQDDPPQDLDDDGNYEDVNGDDQFSIADVQLFFENRDSDVVQNNPGAFNFDGREPADVSIGDVQALFGQFTEPGFVPGDPHEDPVDLSLQPADGEVQPGEQQTYELVVEGATNGTGSYDAEITVGDTDVAEITDVRAFQTSAGLFEATIAEDGSSVQFAGLVQFDAAGEITLAEIDVEAGDTAGQTSIGLTVEEINGGQAGPYPVNSTAGATLTVESPQPIETVDLSLQPADSEVQPGAQQTYELVVEGPDNGIGSYDATITVGDTSVAEVTDARAFQTSTGLFETDLDEDGSSVQFSGLVQFDAASQLTLAEIDVAAADTTGETSLDLSVADIADSDANSYTVESATGATLTVSEDAGPPPLPGQDNAPRDLNDDGLYRDVDGDDEFSIGDVQLFFQNRESDAVQNNPEAFNFDDSDPAEVTIGDVQALFQDFQDGVSQSDGDN